MSGGKGKGEGDGRGGDLFLRRWGGEGRGRESRFVVLRRNGRLLTRCSEEALSLSAA